LKDKPAGMADQVQSYRSLGVGFSVLLLWPPLTLLFFQAFISLWERYSVAETPAFSLANLVFLIFNSYVHFGIPSLILAAGTRWTVFRTGVLSVQNFLGSVVVASALTGGFFWLLSPERESVSGLISIILYVLLPGMPAAVVFLWLIGRFGLLPVGSPRLSKS
jgi:hypothetical protein